MIFYFCNVILWLKSGKVRIIKFEPNKVNVITGDSNTGKTAIMKIIDYCFFASEPKIPESVINESVDWYGVSFVVNNKSYLIARKSLMGNVASADYYFSSTGNAPKVPFANNSEDVIKSIIEPEFKLDSKVVMPFGGNMIKAGSKISLRYFMLFNWLPQSVIENEEDVFFDKQNIQRYREALPRIFDLGIGIETIENVLKKDEKTRLEQKLLGLKNKLERLNIKKEDFDLSIASYVLRMKEIGAIDLGLNYDESLKAISALFNDNERNFIFLDTNQLLIEDLRRESISIRKRIGNLRGFADRHSSYKKLMSEVQDSLKPVEFIKSRFHELVVTSYFDEVLLAFSTDLQAIKSDVSSVTPVDFQVMDNIIALEDRLEEIERHISVIPADADIEKTREEAIYILGQLKVKLELLVGIDNSDKEQISQQISELEKRLSVIHVVDTDQTRAIAVRMIEDSVLALMNKSKKVLGNYASYLPVFNYKAKSLNLRRPNSMQVERIGSSSNHMFLHLFFFLALHQVAKINKSPFIAPYIIIDQLSRPYFGTGENTKKTVDSSDEFKIAMALELLGSYIEEQVRNNEGFQIILLEHVPTKFLDGLSHYHVVETFWDGNALI